MRWVVLTCTHVLDMPCHAHDQASVRKAVDQLPSPALIFRRWYPRSDIPWFDYARARNQPFCQRRRMEAVVMCRSLTEVGMGF
jgi:hypothetical protein